MRIVALLAAALASGCATLGTPPERAEALARDAGLQRVVLPAGAFRLLAYRREARGDLLTVYLEGDGAPWPAPDRPPADPTPPDPLALRLAAADRAATVAWIARPCQYATLTSQPDCDSRYWRGARYGEEVVAALDHAISALARAAGAARVVLVGHSGGGAAAALVAARRTDVAALVTVGGVLDAARWTALHRVSPLAASLDPIDAAARTTGIPQRHFVGTRDAITPPLLAESFAARAGAPSSAIRVEGRDHDCCWTDDWPARLAGLR